MRRRIAGVALLIAAVIMGSFAMGGNGRIGGVSAQEAAATPEAICGVEAYAVPVEPVVEGTPSPVGLYRSVNQTLGPMYYVEFNATPTLNEHLSGFGVFCLEPGGTIPEGDYNQSIILIAIPKSAEGGSLHFDLIGGVDDGDASTEDLGWVEICRSAEGRVCDPSAATPTTSGDGDFDLAAGESARLINMQFTVSNPGASNVVFWVASLNPGSGGCPTKCWISP